MESLPDWLPSPYSDALREVIKRLKPMLDRIVCIGITGSAARRDDFIPGLSDVDLMVVARDEETLSKVREVVRGVNEKYRHVTPSGREGIISLWADVMSRFLKWFGRGCEYYNVMRDFVIIYGEDVRRLLRRPTRTELIASVAVVLREVERLMSRAGEARDVRVLPTPDVARGVFALLRFYLCLKGIHTASRIEMVREVEARSLLPRAHVETLKEALRVLLEGRKESQPELNVRLYELSQLLTREMRASVEAARTVLEDVLTALRSLPVSEVVRMIEEALRVLGKSSEHSR